MRSFDTLHRKLPALLVAALLTACGGGGGGGNGGGSSTPPEPQLVIPPCPTTPQPTIPVTTGDTAIDGFNWFNYRRAGIGLSVLASNAQLNTAALGHSNYQRLNNTISHDQIPGNPGFTGASLGDRLNNAGYVLSGEYAYGEVISAAGDKSGFFHAEELVAAIYHRFIVFEPMFRDMGTGASSRSDGYTYFTADMATTRGFGAGLGRGKIVTYPFHCQSGVPTSFDSDSEVPDPVPNQNTVGYPISVHSDIIGSMTVNSFTIRPRGGAIMSTRLLSSATDSHTQSHEAAIVPLSRLTSGTTYDVSFSGTVDGVAVTQIWSFTTK